MPGHAARLWGPAGAAWVGALVHSCQPPTRLHSALQIKPHAFYGAQLGRFTLRDEGRTIAIGKVLKIPKRGALAE